MDATTIKLTVEGMTCKHCVMAVTKAVKAKDPAAEVSVDLAAHTVTAKTALPRDAVAAAVAGEGYQVVG
jgi:copper chaperone